MNVQATCLVLVATLTTPLLGPLATAAAAQPNRVRFDLAPVSPAGVDDSSDPSRVSVRLHLSSMIESAEAPGIDQWLVRCQPRDTTVRIVDYAPRTETASDLATPIQVKRMNEENKVFGFTLDGSYGHAVRAHGGADHAAKKSSTLQFDRVAPEQAVTAAGTINRGRGVYFKLRWTAQQVLEGEKTFELTLQVPATWRGSLLDVSVVAHAQQKSLAGWDRETKTIGSANFVVAVHREGDQEAATLARALADAEMELREADRRHRARPAGRSLPAMLRQVAMKLDLQPSEPGEWLGRLLLGQADPHLDKEINRLPMSLRIAVLDYADARDRFRSMAGEARARFVAAKPAVMDCSPNSAERTDD